MLVMKLMQYETAVLGHFGLILEAVYQSFLNVWTA